MYRSVPLYASTQRFAFETGRRSDPPHSGVIIFYNLGKRRPSGVVIVVGNTETLFLIVMHRLTGECTIVDDTAGNHLVHRIDKIRHVVRHERCTIARTAMFAVFRRVGRPIERITGDILSLPLVPLLVIILEAVVDVVGGSCCHRK
jgi:hypothetical protein